MKPAAPIPTGDNMEPDTKVEKSVEMVLGGPAGVQVLPNGTGGIIAGTSGSGGVSTGSPTLTAPTDNSLPQPIYLLTYGRVMTDEQLETLRRQISVYATICNQLVEMHKAIMAQQAAMPSMMVGQHLAFDPALGARSTGRQRWTPSQIQLQILEKLFDKANGTPNKQKIKEITVDLSQHGQISETNVYNWFQNRKARAKRKQHSVTHKDAESEVDTDEVESRKDKRAAIETSQDNQGSGKIAHHPFSLDGSFGVVDQKPNVSNQILETQDGSYSTLLRPQVDTRSNSPLNRGVSFDQGFTERSRNDFGTIVVLIDGKPWEVPSGMLDLKGSFGERAALLDSQRQMIPTDETGFTINPLRAGESYTLIKLGKGVGGIAPEMVSQE